MFSKRFIIFQITFLIAIAILGTAYFLRPHVELPVFGQVQDFKLINSDEKPTTLADLNGKVWVADFMFTSCGNMCPMLTANMKGIYSHVGNDKVRFVSISVNPENDTPAVLKKYAEKFNVDTKRWYFLTGSREDITKLAVESFKIGDTKEPIFHSGYFVLVDQRGAIRGYYDGTDAPSLKKLTADLKSLI